MLTDRRRFVAGALALAASSLVTERASADDAKDAQEFVNKAKATFQNFASDPAMTWFRGHVKDAHAVLIVPQLLKAGFIFGGSGGTGVLLAKDTKGSWSDPAFYTMGSVSWGLQIGGELAEVVMLVMTKRGINAFLSTKLQLGADVSVAAGPVGAGGQAATADIIQFSRTKGVFGGLTLEGALVAIRDSLNNAYYGKQVDPTDILVRRDVSNPQARSLVQTVAKIAGNK
jgi:lipid-binding SYLF domain-containing protein